MKKYVYMFPEGNGKMRELLGGKGANLAEMTGLGMPVPQGFTITTEACTRYYEDGKTIYPDIQDQILLYLDQLEKITGKTLGDPEKPLLVSVRSGARASMPGMMDTILNLGMNDEICEAVAKLTNNPRFARDSYRRFIQMFSDVVMELPKSSFEQFIDQVKDKKGVKMDNELDADDMSELIVLFKDHYKKSLGEDFPQDPKKQLMEAVRAVFRSWDNPRANTYRRMNDIPHSWGTAVNVQSMVFGNMGETSGTGVAFTRNPATGEKKLYGEFLMNAQGEDVVAGIRTPQPISALADTMPEVYQQFVDISSRLEKHYGDMQDMEFTIENGKLYMLQTRNGKRTAQAALKVAVDLVDEGVCTKEQAVMKVEAKQLDALLHPTFDPAALKAATPITTGLPASPGAACGAVYFTADDAAKAHKTGIKAVLVRQETSPEDIDGMAVSEGIMTARGAEKALEAGASGIVVSNHGGRVLDHCPATAEVLPEIVDAVGGKMTIFVDGAIRSGMDMFKALALGADAVLIGRPFVTTVYGGGEEGVQLYVQKLKAELADTMRMCGAHSLAEIKRSMLFGF